MTDDYEIAMRKWVASKQAWSPFEWFSIVRVEVSASEGYHYSECTYDYGSCELLAVVNDHTGDRYFMNLMESNGLDFAGLLGEILAVEVTDEERAKWAEIRP